MKFKSIAWVFITVFLLLNIVKAGEYSPDGNTIALYHLNNNGDDATGTYDLDTVTATYTTESKLGSHALHLNGSQFASELTLFDSMTENGTVEFWFKPNKTLNSSLTEGQQFIFKKNLNNDYFGIRFYHESGKICFYITNEESQMVCSATTIWNPVWHHIAGTWGKNGMFFYVNGTQEDANSSYTNKMDDGSSYDFQIGRVFDGSGGSSYFHGTIDEIRISDIQRTEFNTGLFVNLVSPENKTYFSGEVWINATINDNAYNCFAEFKNHNFTMSNSSLNYSYHNTSVDDGTYRAGVWCNQSGTWFSSDFVYFTIWTKPHYSDVKTKPESGQTYPLPTAQFNITWETDYEMYNSLIEHNFNGTLHNYSMFNVSNEYYYNFSGWSAGNYVFRFHGNDTKGYINTTGWYDYIVNPADSGILLSSSSGWSINTSVETTITCTANDNVTLLKDGVIVSNPYIASLDLGKYNFTCLMLDDKNYTPSRTTNFLTVSGSGFGCTNNETYAFSKTYNELAGNNYTLNFTKIVKNGLVKSNMGDIYIPGVQSWKNTTNGYYLTVNISNISNFTVNFGNYLSNISYPNSPLSENVTSVGGYTEVHAYYTISIFDEISGEKTLPPKSNVSITFLCSKGETNFFVNKTDILVPIYDSKLDEMKAIVNYAGDYYSRTLLVSSPIEQKSIYLADAYTQTILQIPIYIDDYSYYNSKISICKANTGITNVITSGYFDAEHKFVTYLVKDEKYHVILEKTGETRDIGFIYPATANSIFLTINAISLAPDISLISNNLIMSAELFNDSIKIQYYDKTEQTNSLRILVYENINQTPFWNNTYNGNNITITISPVNASKRYTVRFSVNHQTYGNSPVEFTVGVGGFGALIDLGVASGVATWLYPGIAFIITLLVSFVALPKNRFAGLAFLIVSLTIFMYAKWFVFTTGVLALLVIFIVISVIYEIKKGEMT